MFSQANQHIDKIVRTLKFHVNMAFSESSVFATEKASLDKELKIALKPLLENKIAAPLYAKSSISPVIERLEKEGRISSIIRLQNIHLQLIKEKEKLAFQRIFLTFSADERNQTAVILLNKMNSQLEHEYYYYSQTKSFTVLEAIDVLYIKANNLFVRKRMLPLLKLDPNVIESLYNSPDILFSNPKIDAEEKALYASMQAINQIIEENIKLKILTKENRALKRLNNFLQDKKRDSKETHDSREYRFKDISITRPHLPPSWISPMAPILEFIISRAEDYQLLSYSMEKLFIEKNKIKQQNEDIERENQSLEKRNAILRDSRRKYKPNPKLIKAIKENKTEAVTVYAKNEYPKNIDRLLEEATDRSMQQLLINQFDEALHIDSFFKETVPEQKLIVAETEAIDENISINLIQAIKKYSVTEVNAYFDNSNDTAIEEEAFKLVEQMLGFLEESFGEYNTRLTSEKNSLFLSVKMQAIYDAIDAGNASKLNDHLPKSLRLHSKDKASLLAHINFRKKILLSIQSILTERSSYQPEAKKTHIAQTLVSNTASATTTSSEAVSIPAANLQKETFQKKKKIKTKKNVLASPVAPLVPPRVPLVPPQSHELPKQFMPSKSTSKVILPAPNKNDLLCQAIRNKNRTKVTELLNENADPNACDAKKTRCIEIAFEAQDLLIIEKLFKFGANLNLESASKSGTCFTAAFFPKIKPDYLQNLLRTIFSTILVYPVSVNTLRKYLLFFKNNPIQFKKFPADYSDKFINALENFLVVQALREDDQMTVAEFINSVNLKQIYTLINLTAKELKILKIRLDRALESEKKIDENNIFTGSIAELLSLDLEGLSLALGAETSKDITLQSRIAIQQNIMEILKRKYKELLIPHKQVSLFKPATKSVASQNTTTIPPMAKPA